MSDKETQEVDKKFKSFFYKIAGKVCLYPVTARKIVVFATKPKYCENL